jgi:hypothetical protein
MDMMGTNDPFLEAHHRFGGEPRRSDERGTPARKGSFIGASNHRLGSR